MIPPIWICVRINWFWIPIPVFPLWPVIAIVWIILGLLLTVALLITSGGSLQAGAIWTESWRLLCGLRGTRVDVEQSQISVKVIIV